MKGGCMNLLLEISPKCRQGPAGGGVSWKFQKNCGRSLCEIPSQAEKFPDDLHLACLQQCQLNHSLGVQFYLEIMHLLYHLKKIWGFYYLTLKAG